MKTPVLLLFATALALTAHSQLKIENGVSAQLANYRSKVISNLKYRLHFEIPNEKSVRIKAFETISFKLSEASAPLQIDFKAGADQLLSVLVNGKVAETVFEHEHIIVDNKLLKEGENAIAIQFIAGDLSLNRNDEFLYTLLVPDRARTVFPCFDQPNLKAKFELSLSLPNEWAALTNGPLKDSLPGILTFPQEKAMNANGIKTYRFGESDLISTYLFSFSAGKFSVIEKATAGMPMHFFYRETDSTKIRLSIDTVFDLHGKSIQFLEDYTQIKFPFQKFDFVALPGFQYGGMEHVGAIDYKASTLFLDSGATKDQENARANLVAHETSHMWFGDLVTMEWFNDVWMKEVFANFMADKITQGTQSSSNYELKFLLTHAPRAYAVDRTAGANAIRQPLENLQEAGTLYGAIIYDKAPIMMRQLERLMGAEAFRDGLREYLKTYAFANATWPDLIQILDKRTPADLQSWNKVWVNAAGRPQFHYSLEEENRKVKRLAISQAAETGDPLPQFFEIALIYPDRVEEFTVNMDRPEGVVQEVEGKESPSFILLNSSGQGYGLFPVQGRMTTHFQEIKDPVMRASAYINLYENMLAGQGLSPSELLQFFIHILPTEPEELNLNMIAGHVSEIFWRLLKPGERQTLSAELEQKIWTALQNMEAANKKKILFRTYQSIALTPDALQQLYSIWKEKNPPAGVKLSEDDYTSLALNLVVKSYHPTEVVAQQLSRISNPDRRNRLEFLMPALSPDENVRDSFFISLKDPQVRKKESWTAEALGYLHHPLRADTSKKYLAESLDMLQQVQMTGDIFFPLAWLSATFGNYQTPEAANVVREFLAKHPEYNVRLKAKILQATDPLFRAERLLYRKK
ncbi:MAG: M1 family metallopeptidase [Flavisolibacter sp.]